MTEAPFSTHGWNRYSYVGNPGLRRGRLPRQLHRPLRLLLHGLLLAARLPGHRELLPAELARLAQLGATALLCAGTGPFAPACAGVVAFAITGVTSGDLGLAMRAGLTAFATAFAMNAVGDATGHQPAFGSEKHLQNIAGHALVGCVSAAAQGGKCGPGALSGAVGSFVSPLLRDQSFGFRLVATSALGGLASIAAGGDFGNGALTAAFGYLFNEVALMCRSAISMQVPFTHCGLFVFERQDPESNDLSKATIKGQFSLAGGDTQFRTDTQVYFDDLAHFRGGGAIYISKPPEGMSYADYDAAVIALAKRYKAPIYDPVFGPNSNSAAAAPIIRLGGSLPAIPSATGLYYWRDKWLPLWDPFNK